MNKQEILNRLAVIRENTNDKNTESEIMGLMNDISENNKKD